MPSIYWQLNDPSWLRSRYLDGGRTLDDLAAEIGCHDSTLRMHLARHGIGKHHEIDEAWRRREYIDRGRTMKDIAAELGVRAPVVARARDRYGISDRERPRRPYPQLRDGVWLRRQVAAGRTHRDIAVEIGCSRVAVTMALRRHSTAARVRTAHSV